MKTPRLFFLLLANCILLVDAELPPYVYEQWRAEADTVLTFKTVDVTLTRQSELPSSSCIRDDYYTVAGRIQSVERWQGVDITTTADQTLSLKGQMVKMETWRRNIQDGCHGWVGPSSPLLPTNGKCYRAFLKCPKEESSTPDTSVHADDVPTWHCELAAKGRSLDEFECPNGEC